MTTTRETADHAELARIEALLRGHIRVGASGLAPAVVSHFVFGFDTAASALLSEIAALRGERTFLMEQKEGAEDAIFDALTRATQFERQRDEAVGLLREWHPATSEAYRDHSLEARTEAFLATQGTDQ